MALGGVASLIGQKTANETKAEGETTLYLDLSQCTGSHDWTEASAVTKLRVFTEPATFYPLTKISEGYYSVTADISAGCQFVRIDPAQEATNYVWSYGSDYVTGKDLCTINGYETTWSYGGCAESYEIASTIPSASTKRIWVDPKEGFYDASARAALHVFGGASGVKNYLLDESSQKITVNGERLFYVDVPVDSEVELVRVHGTYDYIYNFSVNFSDIDGYNTAKVVYSWNASLAYSAGNEGNNVTVDYAKLVLDGYSTCENSAANGYQAIDNIKASVLNHLSSSDLNTLRDATLETKYTYGDKIDLMTSKAGAVSPAQFVKMETSDSIAPVIWGVSFAAMAALGTAIVLKRKHE